LFWCILRLPSAALLWKRQESKQYEHTPTHIQLYMHACVRAHTHTRVRAYRVKPQFYIPTFCILCDFMHFSYVPGQMTIRTIFLRFDTSFKWSPPKGKIGVLLHIYIYIYIFIYLVWVRVNIMEVQAAVCVWCYSVGGALWLSTKFGGKEAKPGFTVFVLIRLPSCHSEAAEHYKDQTQYWLQ
jgi:hypothetical protein